MSECPLVPAPGIEYCENTLPVRGRFSIPKRCFRLKGHEGRCSDFGFLRHLASVAPRVSNKIKRDATKTTGAAWLSADAGPNRIDRWAMLLSDDELLEHGIDMAALSEGVQAKLREKAATYDQCIEVAQRLTWSAYGMLNSPRPPVRVQEYLETLFGPIVPAETACVICKGQLDFKAFDQARRGKAAIETAHVDPRVHSAGNVGFAHRFCNIAQGPLTLSDFYDWMETVLQRVGR